MEIENRLKKIEEKFVLKILHDAWEKSNGSLLMDELNKKMAEEHLANRGAVYACSSDGSWKGYTIEQIENKKNVPKRIIKQIYHLRKLAKQIR